MPKRGQHHNDGLNPSKPITTQPFKKKETYAKEAYEHSPKTGDPRPRAVHFEPWNDDIREHPDTTTGSTRARDSDLRSGRSGSDSNQSRRTRGY